MTEPSSSPEIDTGTGAQMSDCVVLIHGAGRGGRMWRGVAPRLNDQVRVIAPDLPGFSDRGSRFTLDSAAEFLLSLAGPTERIHLVGFSLGGAVAIRAASTPGARVATLTVCAAPIAPGVDQPSTVRRYRRIPDRVGRIFSDATSWRDLVDEVASIDIGDAITRLDVPTLVMCGRRDRGALPDARRIAAAAPRSQLLVVPHVGHSWPVVAPAVFARALDGFLGQHRR